MKVSSNKGISSVAWTWVSRDPIWQAFVVITFESTLKIEIDVYQWQIMPLNSFSNEEKGLHIVIVNFWTLKWKKQELGKKREVRLKNSGQNQNSKNHHTNGYQNLW